MQPTKYRKKPVVIEAMLFEEDTAQQVAEWCGGRVTMSGNPHDFSYAIEVPSWEGIVRGGLGCAVIRGIKGEFYVCERSIFEATYEKVE